ncbi:uncharacterized protein PG986_006563 [Apiospora aurea]|uniref:Peptidase S53 domain-containing protein n=1 Tax=Apiospora aurea TaxID=335848 RepID=A0ABR1QMB6_9PEZI
MIRRALRRPGHSALGNLQRLGLIIVRDERGRVERAAEGCGSESRRGFEIEVLASQAESLFGAKFSYYTRDGADKPVARTEAYSLPLGLRDDIDFVYPTIPFFDSARSRVAEHYNVVNVNGAENIDSVGKGGIEAQLDMEYSTAFTGPLNVTYHLVGGRPPVLDQPGNKPRPIEQNNQEPYLEYLPRVVSNSYTDDEQSVPLSYANHVCDRFSYLALRGVSVLVASGDAGIQGTTFSDCKDPDGENRFIPTFPAACPWVTTVGAATSWGGFSNYFAQPAWQKDAVAKYLGSGDTGMPENP